MRASACVGRVGGLAVALGVGAAIATGAIGVASAAPDQDSASEADSASRAAAAGSTGAAPRPRGQATARGPRTGRAAAERNDGPAPASAIRPAGAVPTPKLKQPLASEAPGPVRPAELPAPDSAVASVEPARAALPTVPAPITRTSGRGAPAESTMGWVVLAAARRSSGPLPATSVAATLATGQAPDPTAEATAGAIPEATGSNSIATLLANRTPTQTGTQTGQGPTGVITGTIAVTDPDSDAFTFAVATKPVYGTVQIDSAGQFVYTPEPAAVRTGVTDTFTVTVSDAPSGFHIHGLCGLINLLTSGLIGTSGHSETHTVTVTLDPVNTAPTATVTVGTPDGATGLVTGLVSGADSDGDPLSYSGSVTTAKGAAVVAADGSFSYVPTAPARHAAARLSATDAEKVDSVTITVSDGYGGSVAVPVIVAITPANTAPVAGSVAGLPDPTTGLVAGAMFGADADGDALSYNGSQTTAKGTVVVAGDGGFTYSPTALARHLAAAADATVADTSDTFIVTVADGHGGTVAVPVTVTVSPAAVAFAFAYGSGSQHWTPEARTALESAAATLASYIVVDRPVTVSYDVLGENIPGSGWLATASATFSSGSPGYYGTVAQAKILTGTDANGATADGRLTVNFAYPWALGDTMANDRYDFQSVVIHELVHTLGFITGFGTDPASIDRNWTTYESFLAGADGISPIGPTYVWNSAYTPNLTGGNGGLYFAGPNAVRAYGGLVPIYTPGDWTPGSSLSHVDPAFAPPGTVYLMDPSDSYGPGVRVITAVEVGILTDLGYTIHAFVFVGFGVARRRRRYAPIAARHCSRSETR